MLEEHSGSKDGVPIPPDRKDVVRFGQNALAALLAHEIKNCYINTGHVPGSKFADLRVLDADGSIRKRKREPPLVLQIARKQEEALRAMENEVHSHTFTLHTSPFSSYVSTG